MDFGLEGENAEGGPAPAEEDEALDEEDTEARSDEKEEDSEGSQAEDGEEAEEKDQEGSQGQQENDILADDEDIIKTDSFDELRLSEGYIQAAQEVWRMFLSATSSREAAGEAIYNAIYDGAPNLQNLFTTPKAVQAIRFVHGLGNLVTCLEDPPALKVAVETLSFWHMTFDVTMPRVAIFRDILVDLFQIELGESFNTEGMLAWRKLLNYTGGAIIYIKNSYSERLRVLEESWKHANTKAIEEKDLIMDVEKSGHVSEEEVWKPKKFADGDNNEGALRNAADVGKQQHVPTNFPQMFIFNAVVMGFGENAWFQEVLACFENIVLNIVNSGRIQEECDFLVLRIAKKCGGNVNLDEFKSCMLASLRSLLPKEWTSKHEVAWCWLWDHVEKLLLKNMGSPPAWEKALERLMCSLDDSQGFEMRASIYAKFFASNPSSQDYFKQNNTYLHLIAIKILNMSVDLYREPVRMSDDISALGLRHVGYGIPTDLFGPFVSICIEVFNEYTRDEVVLEAFRWSLGLISKSLVRTIIEGSTIVMRAINLDQRRALKKAVACAPRGDRAGWLLVVQVGTQNISPLAWAIEAGSLEAASAILGDLLTFRSDRDGYYYGAEELFTRHPDIVKKLCDDAPALLPQLLDGLIWRSRFAMNGMRRVNYYVKHMIVGPEGKLAKTLEWVWYLKDPKLVCHPTLVLVTDCLWSRLVSTSFLLRKSWFLLTLVVFVVAQSVFKQTKFHEPLFACRAFIYVCSLGQLIFRHAHSWVKAYRHGLTRRFLNAIPLPSYLFDGWQDVTSFALTMLLYGMLFTEPILYCIGENPSDDHFDPWCDGAADVRMPYSKLSMIATFLYYALLADMAVFSTRLSAYTLACGRMLNEVALFALALLLVILSFAFSVTCMHIKGLEEFRSLPYSIFFLWEFAMGVVSDERHDHLAESKVLMMWCYVCLGATGIFLTNLLIAQLSSSYNSTYQDMVGFARLKRMRLIIDVMVSVSGKRWQKFVRSLDMDRKLEFNEGDVGLAGGIQVLEPAGDHPTTADIIHRFGGSTSATMPWPDEGNDDDESDKYAKLQKLIQKNLSKLLGKDKRRHGMGSGFTGSGESNNASGTGSAGSGNENDSEEP